MPRACGSVVGLRTDNDENRQLLMDASLKTSGNEDADAMQMMRMMR